VATDEDDIEPWLEPPSRKKEIPVTGPLPDQIKLVLGNQIYIEKEILSPSLTRLWPFFDHPKLENSMG